jgi:hypothetical protein
MDGVFAMENANSDKLFKFLAAWVVGAICLPGLSLIGGAILTSVVKIAWLQAIAVYFFFLGYYGFVPCLAFTCLLAVFCGALSPNVKRAMISSALLNLGIVAFLAMLVGGVF